MYPETVRYTKDHEWIEAAGEIRSVGVSFFAQKELGDVVFVELPEPGRRLAQGEEFGTIESVKAVSEIYAPVAGEVVEVNGALRDHPELVNTDPYGAGWIMKVRVTDAAAAAALMDAAAYQKLVGSSGH